MAFTIKQQRFINAWDGDIRRAAQKAKISYSHARKLVLRSEIIAAIQNRERTEKNKNVATKGQRQEFWTKTMNARISKRLSMGDKLRASELLGKSQMDFAEKHVHEGKIIIQTVDCRTLVPEKEWSRLSQTSRN